MVGVDGTIGLSEVLSGQVQIEDALHTTDVAGLFVLPAGRIPPNPSEMVGSQALQSLVTSLSQRYFVVIDTPPVLPVTDAALLSLAVDGTILLAAAGRTHKEDLALARHMLDQVHARVLGTVLNNVSARDVGEGYEYQRNSVYYVTPHAHATASGATSASSSGDVEEGAVSRRAARRGT